MNVDRIVFIGTMLIGLPALAFSYGQQAGVERAAQTCPSAQGSQTLLSSVQRQDGAVLCVYAASGTGYGRAKEYRAAK